MSQQLNPPILWHKVIAIAAIQGTITLTWVVYNMYLPDLLKQLGLAAGMAQLLLIIEHFLEVIIEPIAGNFSDQQERKIGTRLPIITIGILISATLFLSIPATVIFGNKSINYLLIIMAILWAGAMAIFRAPVMSLLRKTANHKYLAQAASLLTLFSSIIGALQFDVFGIILKLGAPFAFFLGTVALLGSGFAIQKVFPPEIKDREITAKNKVIPNISVVNLAIIIVTGISVGLGLKFFYATLTPIFNNNYGDQGKLVMMLFSIFLGISALFTGKIAIKLGNGKGIFYGTLLTGIFVLILVFIPVKLITNLAIIVLLISFSLVLNGVFPFILALIPEEKTGFGMGLYFGCFGGAISLFILLTNYLKTIFTKITPEINSIGGFICFAIASSVVYFSLKQTKIIQS